MIGLDLAVRQVAFAQARTSTAEAMMIMVGHQQEIERATSSGGTTPEQEGEHFAELAEELRQSTPAAATPADEKAPAPLVDKLA